MARTPSLEEVIKVYRDSTAADGSHSDLWKRRFLDDLKHLRDLLETLVYQAPQRSYRRNAATLWVKNRLGRLLVMLAYYKRESIEHDALQAWREHFHVSSWRTAYDKSKFKAKRDLEIDDLKAVFNALCCAEVAEEDWPTKAEVETACHRVEIETYEKDGEEVTRHKGYDEETIDGYTTSIKVLFDTEVSREEGAKECIVHADEASIDWRVAKQSHHWIQKGYLENVYTDTHTREDVCRALIDKLKAAFFSYNPGYSAMTQCMMHLFFCPPRYDSRPVRSPSIFNVILKSLFKTITDVESHLKNVITHIDAFAGQCDTVAKRQLYATLQSVSMVYKLCFVKVNPTDTINSLIRSRYDWFCEHKAQESPDDITGLVDILADLAARQPGYVHKNPKESSYLFARFFNFIENGTPELPNKSSQSLHITNTTL